MNKTLLITAVFGWLAFSQTAHAHDKAPAEAPTSARPAAQKNPAEAPSHLQMAQITDPGATNLPAQTQAQTDDNNQVGMPSVPVGLAGLFVMLCVLVKRRGTYS